MHKKSFRMEAFLLCLLSIILASQTYRNSECTIFIKLCTTGGEQSTAQDAIEVYGQYSGTNSPVTDPELYSMTTNRNQDDEDAQACVFHIQPYI